MMNEEKPTLSIAQGDDGKWRVDIDETIGMTEQDKFLYHAFGGGMGSDMETKPIVEGYFTEPASKGHHLAKAGGLVEHSVNVTRRLLALTDALHVKWPRKESPYLVGMFHDMVKCRCYRPVPCTEHLESPSWEYVQPEYPGHGACSVAIAAELGIQLMREEIAAITFHMGPWGVGKEYSEQEMRAAMKVFAPQIIATHTADWYAAEVDEREVAS